MAVLSFLLCCTPPADARRTQTAPASQCTSSIGATLSSIPSSVVERTALNPAAKATVSALKFCFTAGEQVYIRPTEVVHYFVRQKSGTIRSRSTMLAIPSSATRQGSQLALAFPSGVIRSFPDPSYISSDTSDDYEIYIVNQGSQVPTGLRALRPDYVFK